MQITKIRLSNFQSFGPEPTEIDLQQVVYVLGPNGAGKTAVLTALSRLFSPLQGQRKIQIGDFHIPEDRSAAEVHLKGTKLWIEVDIEIPEAEDPGQHATVAANFAHMRIDADGEAPRVRIRLTGVLAPDGVVEETIQYVLSAGDDGEPVSTADMNRYDRGSIEVHYMPARRDPADQISYTAASLLGRLLRAADWTAQKASLEELSESLTAALGTNAAVTSIGTQLKAEWGGLHTSNFFSDPTIAFGSSELEGVLRQLTVTFAPSPDGARLPFERLSDGQKSLLYISLVLAWQSLSRKVLRGEELSFDENRLRPPVHTVIALEEPENSLAPQYLGRIIRQLRGAADEGNVQSLIATHSPALLRRVDPETICFLRLNGKRQSKVRRVVLPADGTEAGKYVREAVLAHPELYFSRLVVLGEGDSELVVLPRVLAARGIAEDDASVSVVPLGGRHVNHFWRLLTDLDIPHVTLLDLDSGRFGGGWGRVTNALKQYNKLEPNAFTPERLEKIPSWNSDKEFPSFDHKDWKKGRGPIPVLEEKGVFFSHPVDLDLMMLEAYPEAYGVEGAEEPDEATIIAVLGKHHANEDKLDSGALTLFGNYHAKFDLKSKPASHLQALSNLSDEQLISGLPDVLERLAMAIEHRLAKLPE